MVYFVSFFLTWYRVWWENLIGLVVAFIGVLAARDPVDVSKINMINAYYYGSIVAFGSQAIAIGCLIYYLVESHVLATNLGLNELGSVSGIWVFYSFLIMLVTGHAAMSLIGATRARNFRAELLQNSGHYTALRNDEEGV